MILIALAIAALLAPVVVILQIISLVRGNKIKKRELQLIKEYKEEEKWID